MHEIYIGLASGTSAEGIDAVAVTFDHNKPHIIATHYREFTKDIQEKIVALFKPGLNEIHRMSELDPILSNEFAAAVNDLLQQNALNKECIRAIGSHGQTIRHHDYRKFTMQLSNPNTIAAKTGITTVANFCHYQHGGKFTSLDPTFHHAMLAEENKNRAIVNIGGMAHVTLLSGHHVIAGFDAGPGNALLDAWMERNQEVPYDKDGAWAAQGKMNHLLLRFFLEDPYFDLPPPKNIGREHFNLQWILQRFRTVAMPPDAEASLVELTCITIIRAIKKYFDQADIIVYGGGVHNLYLMQRLRALAEGYTVYTSDEFGIDPDWTEAITFAWLAKKTLEQKPENTDTSKPTILGAIFPVTNDIKEETA